MTQKTENKLEKFTNANKRLREIVSLFRSDPTNEVCRDALIQRFEFTFELAWKTIAEVLREHGVKLEFITPKSVLKAAYAAGYINNEEDWVKLLDDRNLMSHTYDEETAIRIANDICTRYFKTLGDLQRTLNS